MADQNTEKKHQAQALYMAGGKTQKEIADIVGVSERTVHAWIHQYAWDKLRLASFQAPATIADNLCAQIVELQNAIAAREPGLRYATPQEAEVMRKLITSWERMKKYPSLSVHMQVLETFRNYVRPLNRDFTAQLSNYTEKFIEAKSVNGYAPYQVEYGVEPVSPILPGYEEADGLDENAVTPRGVCPKDPACRSTHFCYDPACRDAWDRDITIADYKVTPVHFMRGNIQPPKPVVAAEPGRSIPATPEGDTGSKTQPQNSPGIAENLPAPAKTFFNYLTLDEGHSEGTQEEINRSNSAVSTSGGSTDSSTAKPQDEKNDKQEEGGMAA